MTRASIDHDDEVAVAKPALIGAGVLIGFTLLAVGIGRTGASASRTVQMRRPWRASR